MTHSQKRALTAAAMSAVIPGSGQLANGDYVVGIFWLVMAPIAWFSAKPTLGWLVHILAALSAYWAVQRRYQPRRHGR